MRRSTAAACVVLAAMCVNGCQAPKPPVETPAAAVTQDPTPIFAEDMHPSPDRPGTVVGNWHGDVSTRGPRAPVDFTVATKQGDAPGANTSWRSDTAIEGLPPATVAAPVHFGLARSAGVLTFDGLSDGKLAHGIVRFEPDPAYSSDINRMYGPASPQRLFELALVGFDLPYAQALYDASYRFRLDEAVQLYRENIATDYAIELRKAGYELSSGDLIQLAHNGIAAAYARQIRQGGWLLSTQDLIELNHGGIGVDYGIAVHEAGAAATVADVVFLQHAGVTADEVRQLAGVGYRFNAADVVKIHHSGIIPDYPVALKKAGYALGADDIIRLQHAGVDADYAAALHVPDRENLPVDEIINLHDRGVNADTIRKLRK